LARRARSELGRGSGGKSPAAATPGGAPPASC
jgi:hypothetical protein